VTQPPSTASADAGRNVGIDLLRAVAILSVVGLHWIDSRWPTPANSWLGDVFVRMVGHGTYGVTLFFVLSGFLITRMTMVREPDLFGLSARDFYVRRIARIQPLYLLAIALGALILLSGDPASAAFRFCFHDPSAVFTADFWISLLTFTFNWDRILHGNFWGVHWDVMWSLAVEEQFYLAFPLLLIWAGTKRRLAWSLGAVIAIGIAVRVLVDALGLSFFAKVTNSFVCFDTLALGVLLAVFGERLPRGRAVSLGCLLIGTVAVLWAFYRGGVHWLILGGALFLHGARYAPPLTHRAWRPLARFGQLSYGIYLLHGTVLYLAAPIVTGMNPLAGFAVVAVLVLLLAEALYRLYEAPMNAWIRASWIAGPAVASIKA
jgi:peptidoglycan/LPS O-acetylase OafA/YrhL